MANTKYNPARKPVKGSVTKPRVKVTGKVATPARKTVPHAA